MSSEFKLTKCVIEGCYLKFHKQVAVNSYDTKCERCGKIVHIIDKTYFKRKTGAYTL